MPVHNGDGVLLTEPGGALQLDVDASPLTAAVTTQNGVLVAPQFGAEALMVGGSAGGGTFNQTITAAFTPLTFATTKLDDNEWSDTLQCDPASGVFTALRDGIYDVGIQVCLAIPTGAGGSGTGVQLAVWTDAGTPSLPLNPPVAFGTANGAVGAAWQRIAQHTYGFTGFPAPSSAPTKPEIPGWLIQCSAPWVVHNAVAPYTLATPAPTRFRFSLRTNILVFPMFITGQNEFQTRAWMRWLGHTP